MITGGQEQKKVILKVSKLTGMTGNKRKVKEVFFGPGEATPLTKVQALSRLFVGRSITKSTNDKHRALVEQFHGCTVGEIIEYCDRQMHTRRWACTTVRTTVGNLIGANNRTSWAVFPKDNPQMKDYIRHVDQLCLSYDVKFPHPLTKEVATAIAERLKSQKEDDLLALFALQWSTTGRTSDVLLVRKKRLVIDPQTGSVQVTFVEGKGVKARGSPYTVASSTPFIHAIKRQCNVSASPLLFPMETHTKLRARLRATLHKFDRRLELRSLRRGSLQHMASLGTSLDVLMTFSGHRSTSTLLRYLNWGTFAGVMLADQTKAAALLW